MKLSKKNNKQIQFETVINLNQNKKIERVSSLCESKNNLQSIKIVTQTKKLYNVMTIIAFTFVCLFIEKKKKEL